MNDRFNIVELQPKSETQRSAVATRCCEILSHPWPMLVDSIDDKTGNEYSAFPDRLYLVDAEGRIVYKSGRGPFGYSPTELEQALLLLLVDQQRQAALPVEPPPAEEAAASSEPAPAPEVPAEPAAPTEPVPTEPAPSEPAPSEPAPSEPAEGTAPPAEPQPT